MSYNIFAWNEKVKALLKMILEFFIFMRRHKRKSLLQNFVSWVPSKNTSTTNWYARRTVRPWLSRKGWWIFGEDLSILRKRRAAKRRTERKQQWVQQVANQTPFDAFEDDDDEEDHRPGYDFGEATVRKTIFSCLAKSRINNGARLPQRLC